MLATAPLDIRDLIARRRPGYSLQAPFYTSREVFDLDCEVIFGRHWIYVGVEPDVPEPGDTMVADIGRNSVIVIRDDDGLVRAFHNVCRHRGARLLHEEKSTVGNIVCRYHGWTYDTRGALLLAEHMGPDFDRTCRGLKPVALRSLAGLLFVCLAEEPPGDFDQLAAELTPYIAPHGVPGLKVAHQSDLIEPGNWKLTMENNRECYHCAANHPELCQSLYEYGFGFAPDELSAEKQADAAAYAARLAALHHAWESTGLPSREIDHLDDRVTGYRTERLPIQGDGEAHTLDTRAACAKPIGAVPTRAAGGLHLWTQPNSWHHFFADHVVTFAVFPLDPERALLRTKWLVHKDAVEGVDYDLENLTGVWLATNDQDSTLVGYTQQGVRSVGYEPGPYSSYTEGLVEKFARWYIGRLQTALGSGLAPA